MQLTIGSRTVTVDDAFRNLTPEQQNATVQEIARSLPKEDAAPAAPAAETPDAAPVTANRVVRSAATGVPIVGGVASSLNALTNAALAPVVEPFLEPSESDISRNGEGFWDRYRKSLAMQEQGDAAFSEAHPVVDTAAKVAGGVAGSLPLMTAAPRAFGLVGPLRQQVAAGALSNAALAGADAAVRGNDVVKEAEFGGLLGAGAPLAGRAVGKLVSAVRGSSAPARSHELGEVAGRKVYGSRGQALGDVDLQAEEEILRKGAGRSGDIARSADDLTRADAQAASDQIAGMLDPAGRRARTAPQDAGGIVSQELQDAAVAAEAARNANAGAVSAEGQALLVALGGGRPAPMLYDAAGQIGEGVATARNAVTAARDAKYAALRAAEGQVDDDVIGGLSENIRQRMVAGDNPVWVDPDTTGQANKALRLLQRDEPGGIFTNAAAPAVPAGPVGPIQEAAAAAEGAGWQGRAKQMADELIAMGVNPVKARATAAVQEGGPLAPHDVAVPGGGSVSVVPKVVEASSLKTSADAGYDAALQPRQRGRAASQAQINDIAANLNPKRLGVSSEADRGAPIIGPDGMVESGNGRVLAIRKAYEAGGDQAAAYRQFLADNGVDVSRFKQPVLVRERATPMDATQRQEFATAANQSATLSMSAPERALADARSLSADSLASLRNPENLGAAENRDFVRQFIAKLPQTEQGAMVNAVGELSAEGLTRVRNAVLAKAFGDSPVLTRVAEATSDDIRSISNALSASAADWAALRAAVERGEVPKSLDITSDLLDAVNRTAKIRAKGTSLESALAQQDAFGKQSDLSESLMRLFYGEDGRSAQSGAKIADALRHYAREASKVDAAPGLGLGLPETSAKDILQLSAKRAGAPAAVAPDVVAKAEQVAAKVVDAAAEKIAPKVGLREVDNARKRLVSMYQSARDSARASGNIADQRAMARILDEFDQVLIEAFDAGKFSGDSAAAKALLRDARAAHAEYRRTFTPQGAGDDVGRAVQKILGRQADTAATPDEIMQLSYGARSAPGGGKAIRVAHRLRQILGENSAEWGAYKQGLFRYLTETPEGVAQRSPAEIADRIDRFLTDEKGGRGLAQQVFSTQERQGLADYATRLRSTEAPARPTGDVAKMVARISGADGLPPATPGEVVDMLYSRAGTGSKGSSVRLAQHLKQNLTPEGWTAVRQGMWEKLTNAGEDKIPFGPQKLSQRLSEFLNESGSDLAKVLFTAAERGEMKKLAAVYEKMIPKGGTVNTSNTAHVMRRMADRLVGNIGAALGLATHGPVGLIAGHLVDKGAKSVGAARDARRAERLFIGERQRPAAVSSQIPALVAPAAVMGGRR